MQKEVSKVIENSLFRAFTITMLIVTSVTLTEPGNNAEEFVDILFLLYFIVEIGSRFMVYRVSKRILNVWLVLDAFILLVR